MDLSEARGLVLCWVIRGGMRDYTEAACSARRLRDVGMLTLEPECLRNRSTHQRNRLEMNWLFPGDTQAACDFSFSTSKFSPFFHSVSVIAAILRASVSRTMVGLMPLASERW